MVCAADKDYRVVIESADLVVHLVEMSEQSLDRISAHLQTGNTLDIPIVGSEVLTFSTPANQMENRTPLLQIPGTSRMLTLFWVSEKGFLGDKSKNATYFPHMSLKRLDVEVGHRTFRREMNFSKEDRAEKLVLAYQQTVNSIGGGMDNNFIKKDVWASSQTLHNFDLSSSGFYAPCLNMAASFRPEEHQSLSIGYVFGKAPTEAHQLVALLEKDQKLRIMPDFSLQLADDM